MTSTQKAVRKASANTKQRIMNTSKTERLTYHCGAGHRPDLEGSCEACRTQKAVRKASGERLLADMARAGSILTIARLSFPPGEGLQIAYILGALEAESSLTVRACLLTAWGC